jgi:hypothetical protein
MLKIIHCFGKRCSCHLQGEYAMFRRFWQPCIEQAVGAEFDSMALIGGATPTANFGQYRTITDTLHGVLHAFLLAEVTGRGISRLPWLPC